MPELHFAVEDAQPAPYSAAPLLNFKLRVEGPAADPIQSVMLRSQIRIDPARRRYSEAEQRKLRDIFGEPARWNQTVRSLLWTHASVVVPPFAGCTIVDLPVPCTFDLTVATAKYFDGLDDGSVPLTLLFSGTIFYETPDGALQVAQIPWSEEAAFDLPVSAWKGLMDLYYPNVAWLCLRRDVFERLNRYKTDRGIPTWEQALESMLP